MDIIYIAKRGENTYWSSCWLLSPSHARAVSSCAIACQRRPSCCLCLCYQPCLLLRIDMLRSASPVEICRSLARGLVRNRVLLLPDSQGSAVDLIKVRRGTATRFAGPAQAWVRSAAVSASGGGAVRPGVKQPVVTPRLPADLPSSCSSRIPSEQKRCG